MSSISAETVARSSIGMSCRARVKLSAVPVPAAEVQRHAAGARLDKPSGDEEILRHLRGAVGAECLGSPLAVSGSSVSGDSLEMSIASASFDEVRMPTACSAERRRVPCIARSEVSDVATELVQGLQQQLLPVLKTLEGNALQHHVVGLGRLILAPTSRKGEWAMPKKPPSPGSPQGA